MEGVNPAASAGASAVAVVLLGCYLLLPVFTAFWAFGDAGRRGKSGCLVALLVLFLAWPMGLIAWLVFRPEPRY